ncbi:MAG: ABC transporter permease subunit [Chloroflexi bacterium]|nr:ABC transporter permease subunit [Chloroflexota bacterium]
MTQAIQQPSTTVQSTRKPSGDSLKLFAFLGGRLVNIVATLLAIIFLSYLGMNMAQGMPFSQALQSALPLTVSYIGQLLQGDLGVSQRGIFFSRPLPIADILPPMLINSLGLLAASMLLAVLLGIPAGIWAATRKSQNASLSVLMLSIIGISVPSFFGIVLLQMAAIQYTKTFGSPLVPVGGFGWDKHLILPMIVLSGRPLAQITRVTFVTIKETLRQDYVRTAQSKGLYNSTIMWRHVFKNAAVPILTVIGLALRFSLSSLPVVETFFGWPGIGQNLLNALRAGDTDFAIISLLCLGLIFITINLLLEIAYRAIDPRLRDDPVFLKSGRFQMRQWLQELSDTLFRILHHNPISAWWRRRKNGPEPSPFKELLARQGEDSVAEIEVAPTRRRPWARSLRNFPLIMGILIFLGLAFIYVFGADFTPRSPYDTQVAAKIGDEYYVAPFPPSNEYPWGSDGIGRDIQAMVLAGAQQTLTLAVVVVVIRLLVGLIMGTLTGWFADSWFDRFMLNLAEILAAFPTLLLVMIFILAIGLQNGMRTFIIAMSFVGWAEIMQFVRGEVIKIRPLPYIESAIASGQRTTRIVSFHMLPNLAPMLVSLLALEAAAVLVLLGELAFIGIFIGGGAASDFGFFADVPEWGAMLNAARGVTRAYPWMAVYPAAAFFITIMGFNLLAEGLRRIVDQNSVAVSRLLNKYTVALIIASFFLVAWSRNNVGPIRYYREDMETFDAQNAIAYTDYLTAAERMGRALGSSGYYDAADYLQQQFRALGLQSGGEGLSMAQTRQRFYQTVDEKPQFTINDGGDVLEYRQDYAEFPAFFRNLGSAAGQVRFLALKELELDRVVLGRRLYPKLEALDLENNIVMVLDEWELYYLRNRPHQAVLFVTDDATDVQRRFTLSPVNPIVNEGLPTQIGQDAPIFWITEETADRLLAGTGQTIQSLRVQREDLGLDGVIDVPTQALAEMKMTGIIQQDVPAIHVLGMMAGENQGLDENLIVVMAQYDMPPLGPDGIYSHATDNANSVGILLEALRVLEESAWTPNKSILFVAYSGEGAEQNDLVISRPNVDDLLEAKTVFEDAFDVEAIIYLRGLGLEGNGDLVAATGGNGRLMDMVQNTARLAGTKASPANDLARFEQPAERYNRIAQLESQGEIRGGNGDGYAVISLSGEGWQDVSRTAVDTTDQISAENTASAGKTLALILMVLGRETEY